MQKYIYDNVLIYAVDHTIKEVQEFFCFPSYQACKRYLLEHHIKHLYECRNSKNNPNYKHGGKHTRLYNIWCGMKRRCYCKNDSHYPRWGERGIKICSDYGGLAFGAVILNLFDRDEYNGDDYEY